MRNHILKLILFLGLANPFSNPSGFINHSLTQMQLLRPLLIIVAQIKLPPKTFFRKAIPFF